jgi:hypothetical protein
MSRESAVPPCQKFNVPDYGKFLLDGRGSPYGPISTFIYAFPQPHKNLTNTAISYSLHVITFIRQPAVISHSVIFSFSFYSPHQISRSSYSLIAHIGALNNLGMN